MEATELIDLAASVAPPLDRFDAECFECVYFLHAIGTDLVKVGWTRNLPERVRALSTSCPHALHVLAIVPGPMSEEGVLHRALSTYRYNGEWFQLTYCVRDWLVTALRSKHWQEWRPMRDRLAELNLLKGATNHG